MTVVGAWQASCGAVAVCVALTLGAAAVVLAECGITLETVGSRYCVISNDAVIDCVALVAIAIFIFKTSSALVDVNG